MLAYDYPHLRSEFLYCLDSEGKRDDSVSFNILRNSSNRTAMWQCPKTNCDKKCKHIYRTQIHHKTKKNASQCPYCLGRKVCECNSFAAKHPDLLEEWSEDNDILPTEVSEQSGKMILWECSKTDCGHHKWITSIAHRVKDESGCPFCAGNRVCICNSIVKMRPDWLDEWSDNNIIRASDASVNSNLMIEWKCKKSTCGHHIWFATPSGRERGYGCPFCAINQYCECYCLASEYPELLNSEWDEFKNDDEGLDIFKLAPHSNKYAWWICSKCQHSWRAQINSRTTLHTGCPRCKKSKMEEYMATLLTSLQGENIITSYVRQWKIPTTRFTLDFQVTLPDGEIILLENDGQHHFKPMSFGFNKKTKAELLQIVQRRDHMKKAWCDTKNIRLLRISYLVKFEDYEAELLDFIQNKNVTFRLVGQPS